MSSFRNIAKPPIVNGLIGWWKLDEGTGTIAKDSSGFGNNGTLIGSPSWGFGRIRGKSIYLNGAQYLSLPFGQNFNLSTFTVTVWLNVSTYSSNPRLMSNSHTDSDFKGFQLMINNGGASGFFDVGTANGVGVATWSSTISTGKWYHYVGVYNGSTVTSYINGVSVASGPITGTLLSGDNNFSIGYNLASTSDYLTGYINDVRLYKRALSQSELTTIYNFD